jgi:hypothetical protein
MLKSRKLAAYALGGFLLLGSGGLAMAQTATTTNPNTTTVSRTDSTHDRNFDWGWLGLLGLVGLAGLMKKDRPHTVHEPRMGATTPR